KAHQEFQVPLGNQYRGQMSPFVEPLEPRDVPSALHYAWADNLAPASMGFNLIDVFSPGDMAYLPPGDKAIVWVGQTNGVDPNFIKTITPYLDDPRVYAFYVCDEPNPLVVPASNLQQEADWIHEHTTAKAFMVLGALPLFSPYTPATTHMDLVGLDPYP